MENLKKVTEIISIMTKSWMKDEDYKMIDTEKAYIIVL